MYIEEVNYTNNYTSQSTNPNHSTIKKASNLPHQNLPILNTRSTNLSTYPNNQNQAKSPDYYVKLETETLNHDLKAKQIKFEKQKEKIKGLKRQLELASTQTDINPLKTELYEELNAIYLQLTQQNDQIKSLTSESIELRSMLSHKNEVISQYQDVIAKSTSKIKGMETLIENMKLELKDKAKIIKSHDKLKEDNDVLLENLQEIKEQLNEIEIVYEQKMHSKNNEIKHTIYSAKLFLFCI